MEDNLDLQFRLNFVSLFESSLKKQINLIPLSVCHKIGKFFLK